MSPKSEWAARAKYVRGAETDKFTDLIELSGLRPEHDLRCLDWSGVDFSNCDLRGYDFSGSYLHGCKFDGARIAGAYFVGAELGRVLLDPERDPYLPALTTPVSSLRSATDWAQASSPSGLKNLVHVMGDSSLRPGAIFQDAPFAPEMVVVPSGTFMMGTSSEQAEALVARYGKDYREFVEREQPQREVTVAHRLAVGRFPVTFEEWDACLDGNDTKHRPDDQKWGRVRRPVTDVSWDDITKAYLPWLNRRLGLSGAHAYRLLTEAEWEYSCRAGTETAYSFGDKITTELANYDGSELGGTYLKFTTDVGKFPSNAWGLHDMHGTVWECCQDVYRPSYEGLPDNGDACEDQPTGKDKAISRVRRGGSRLNYPQDLRSAYRLRGLPDLRGNFLGFRLARTLNP